VRIRKVEKEYLVRVEGEVDEGGLALLNHGLELDGRKLRPAKVEWLNGGSAALLLREGRKRQIRRMCELVGLKVVGLKRCAHRRRQARQTSRRAVALSTRRRKLSRRGASTRGASTRVEPAAAGRKRAPHGRLAASLTRDCSVNQPFSGQSKPAAHRVRTRTRAGSRPAAPIPYRLAAADRRIEKHMTVSLKGDAKRRIHISL